MKKIITLSLAILSLTIVFMFSGCIDEAKDSTINTKDAQASTLNTQKSDEINVQETYKALENSNVILIDVRTPAENQDTHIAGGILIPLDQLNSQTLEANKINKDDTIITYCRSGNRSMTALKELKALGYNDVQSMAGGITAWTKAGYEVE